ncbi:MAG: BLUF domain-containing protein [Pseudomonadota bacterium]
MIYQLVYVSRAAPELDGAALEAMLATARRNNAKTNVTGMLLHHGDSFIQVLEGGESAVERLFNHISNDPRHSVENVMLRTIQEKRAYDSLWMGYKRTEPGLHV